MNVITLAGELDIERYPVFHDVLYQARAVKGPIVIDLREVTLIDASFLTELLLFVRKRKAGTAPVGIVAGNPAIMRTIASTRLSDAFALFSRLEDALAALEPDAAP